MFFRLRQVRVTLSSGWRFGSAPELLIVYKWDFVQMSIILENTFIVPKHYHVRNDIYVLNKLHNI